MTIHYAKEIQFNQIINQLMTEAHSKYYTTQQ